jgi:hypothetical protein
VRTQRQSGIALLTALFVLILVTALAVGMCWMVMTDQRLGGNNQFRETAFYGAEAGMEKLTADVGTTFANEGSLSTADMTTLTSVANQPTITGIQFLDPSGNNTYQILCGTPLASPCTPTSNNATMLPPSPYAGMQGLITPFTLSVTARGTVTGAEVKLTRQVQVVAIPVFQFGIYSDSDVSFFAGPPFDFGGRTHTNGNLWLAANSGPLYLADKVTVAGQVVRTNLENGTPLAGTSYTGVVSIATTPNPATLPPGPAYSNAQWSPLALTEGSVTAAGGPINITNVALATPNGGWPAVENRYNGQLNSGVPILSLTTTALGGLVQPISLIRRPTPGATQAVLNEQYFIEASLRILLDDYPAGVTPGSGSACHNADMMSEQTVTTGTDPVDLAILATSPASIYNGTGNVPHLVIPLPESGAGGAYSATNGYWIQNGKPLITGCLKIEYQNAAGGWTDITPQVLAMGFSGRNINPGAYPSGPPTLPALGSNVAQGPTTNPNVAAKIPCGDPSPNAIIRIARLRDNPSTATAANLYCGNTLATGTSSPVDYWPMALFDSREGTMRTVSTPSQITALGVMYYIELDAGNLATWINSGAFPLNNATGGFTVYFSDRRGELPDTNVGGVKTGSFGFNDVVNLSNPGNGCPNHSIEQGEDLEGDGVLRTYGGAETIPLYPLATGANNWTLAGLWNAGNYMQTTGATPVMQANSVCGAPVLVAPMNASNWPGVEYLDARQARENPPVFFRRALKIVDGQSLNLGTSCGPIPCGLTIASENPVYIQGDYNAPPDGSWSGSSVAAAVAADAITLLSDNWNDVNSFFWPYAINNGNANDRNAVQTAYRTALIAGKGIPFINPAGEAADFGTDGGVHNFLKYLEYWGGVNAYYEGSLVSFYYNRQAVGTYKNWGAVYSPPNRNYFFDQNFTLGPQYLPPRTPSLRSINTIGFSQELLATQ